MVDALGGCPRFVRSGTVNPRALRGCFCPRPSLPVVEEPCDLTDIVRMNSIGGPAGNVGFRFAIVAKPTVNV